MPAGLVPNGSAAGRREDRRRAHRASHASPRRRTARAIGKVDWIEHLGDQNHLHVSVGGHKLVTLVDPEAGLERGDGVSLALVDPLYFDAAGNRIRSG